MAPGRLSSLLACALVLQLAAAPAAVVAVQHGTVAAADFDLAAAAGGRLTISGLALEGEAQPVTLELQRRDVWAPGSKVVVHTAAGTEELGPPASRFFHGSIAGQPHSTVALAVHEDGSVTGMASSGENSYVLGVDGGDAGAARGPGRALLSARRAVLEAPQRRGRRCGNRGSEMPPGRNHTWAELADGGRRLQVGSPLVGCGIAVSADACLALLHLQLMVVTEQVVSPVACLCCAGPHRAGPAAAGHPGD